MDKVFLKKSDKSRGDLYNEHQKYAPTLFESNAEFLLLHHSDGGITEILHTKPEQPLIKEILIMVPGFITILDSWDRFLEGMKDKIEIYYWESREKGTFHPPSSKLNRKMFSVSRYKQDLVELFEVLEIPQDNIILAGSSFGGTQIIDVLADQLVNPKSAILIGANIHFHIPFPGNILIKILPTKMLTWFKPVIRWYLRNFEIDLESDKGQYLKYVKAIELANFYYIKHTVINYHRHPQEHLLKKIKVSTIVVGANLDKMHTIDESQFTVDQIENAELAIFETNKETHSEPFIEYFIEKFG